MKKIMIATAMTAMIGFSLFAATWARTYPELGNATATSVCQTQDSGYAFIGITWLESYCGDLYIAKVDSLGNLLWSKIYHREDQTVGLKIKETPDGLAVLGIDFSTSIGHGLASFWLLKCNSDGDTLWTRNYGTFGRIPKDMDICPDSGFIMTGQIETDNPNDHADILLIRTNKDGNLIWEKNLGGYCGIQVRSREDGFDLLANYDGGWDSWFLRLDSNGDTLWTKYYLFNESGASLHYFSPTYDTGYIMTGITPAGGRVRVTKTDKEAEREWQRNYRTEDYVMHLGEVIWQTDDNGYMAVANIYKSPVIAIWLLKLNDIGDTLWTRIFTGPTGSCRTDCAEKTLDGGAIIGGFVCEPGGGPAYLIKTDENGYVGVAENFPFETFVVTVFPNPSRGKIFFETDFPNPVPLKIYDISGRLIKKTQIEKSLKMNLPSGIYFWKTEKARGKIIVVK